MWYDSYFGCKRPRFIVSIAPKISINFKSFCIYLFDSWINGIDSWLNGSRQRHVCPSDSIHSTLSLKHDLACLKKSPCQMVLLVLQIWVRVRACEDIRQLVFRFECDGYLFYVFYSFTKCTLTSKCLIPLWKAGLFANLIALSLSQKIGTVDNAFFWVDDSPLIGFSPALNLFSHSASLHTSANAWYSLWVVDIAFVFRCRLAQETGSPRRKKMQPSTSNSEVLTVFSEADDGAAKPSNLP